MQSVNWYLKRLASMSPAEIAWRVRALARDTIDIARFSSGRVPHPAILRSSQSLEETRRGFSLERSVSSFDLQPDAARRRATLVRRARAIADGRLDFFDLEDVFLGDPIDWHRDHNAGISASRRLIQFVDYRDFRTNGDCKLVWEPNRHHQFVVLGRAYAATGDTRYARALREQLLSWINANPFGYGMNWRSPLELAVRAINWVFALELCRGSGEFSGEAWRRIYYAMFLHTWEISRKFSYGSSANNHLVGELAGVFVLASYLPELPGAAALVRRTRRQLEIEIVRQSYPDGATREQALGYQFFVIQFYLVCGLVGRWTDNAFGDEFRSRLASMLEFPARLAAAGPLPMYGDQDDGYVLDLGDRADDIGAWLHAAGQLVDLPPAASRLCRDAETAYWLFGDGMQPAQADRSNPPALQPQQFAASGYCLLEARNDRNVISVLFDCAELGYGNIAAHGHADALSIAVRLDGEHVLVDPGTYDYFSYPEWRNYFRSTAAHNTVMIDETDQSEMQGPFMWGRRAAARCTRWETGRDRTVAEGEHDGYQRLEDPVMHRRRLHLDHSSCRLEITDELEASAAHRVCVSFHLGPRCRVTGIRDNVVAVDVGERASFTLTLDPRLKLESLCGSERPRAGWYSPGYHRRQPVNTIRGFMESDRVALTHVLQPVGEA